MNTPIDQETSLLIEEHVRQLLGAMGFDVTVTSTSREVTEKDTEATCHIRISIEAGEAGRLLIGNQGQHLAALQHIIRSLVRRHLARQAIIMVDVNQYRSRRERAL